MLLFIFFSIWTYWICFFTLSSFMFGSITVYSIAAISFTNRTTLTTPQLSRLLGGFIYVPQMWLCPSRDNGSRFWFFHNFLKHPQLAENGFVYKPSIKSHHVASKHYTCIQMFVASKYEFPCTACMEFYKVKFDSGTTNHCREFFAPKFYLSLLDVILYSQCVLPPASLKEWVGER